MLFNAGTSVEKNNQHHHIEEWIKLNRVVVDEVDGDELTFFNRASFLNDSTQP